MSKMKPEETTEETVAVTAEPEAEPTAEPATEPAAVTDAAAAAAGKLTEAEAAAVTAHAAVDTALAAFTDAAAAGSDPLALLKLAEAHRDAIAAAAKADGTVTRCRAAVATATWEQWAGQRDTITRSYVATLDVTRMALTDPLPVPLTIIVPLDEYGRAAAMSEARGMLAAVQLRIAAIEAAAEAVGLLPLGCDRLRVAWEQLPDAGQPDFSVKPVKTGDEAGQRVTRQRAASAGSTGVTRSTAVYTMDGRSYTAEEFARSHGNADSVASIEAAKAAGKSASYTHAADAAMKRLTAAGSTVTKSSK